MAAVTLYLAAAVCALWVVPGSLTAVGERRRGGGWPVTVAAAVFFPITWAAWYVRDEHPYGVVR